MSVILKSWRGKCLLLNFAWINWFAIYKNEIANHQNTFYALQFGICDCNSKYSECKKPIGECKNVSGERKKLIDKRKTAFDVRQNAAEDRQNTKAVRIFTSEALKLSPEDG